MPTLQSLFRSAFLLSLSQLVYTLESWNPNSVRLVDSNSNTNRYLLFGSIPMKDNGKTILMVSLFPNVTDSPSQTIGEVNAIQTERKWAATNPSIGRVTFWNVEGDISNSDSVSEDIKTALVKTFPTWQTDKIWHRVQALRTWLTSKSVSTCLSMSAEVIYIHGGQTTPDQDRSIIVEGIYRMRYQEETYDSVVKDFTSRKIGVSNQNALNTLDWAWEYIQYKKSDPDAVTCTDTNTCTSPILDTDLVETNAVNSGTTVTSVTELIPTCPTLLAEAGHTFVILSSIVFASWLTWCMVYSYLEAVKMKKEMEERAKLQPDQKA